ncbi:MAG: histone deacetylase, partial [Nitrospirota bacterium]|nr:histone deacetylase [Nitrospirota bacterium]
MARTGLVYHQDYLQHDMGFGHPESPDRLRAIMAKLEAVGLLARVTGIEPAKASDEAITQVHTQSYLA